MHKPIIPWPGGKRRLAKYILSLYPAHTCYVEPFAGGAALFFLKPPSKVEVLNDINGELVNLYRIVQNHPEEFMQQFKWALSSRMMFKWEQIKRPETLTDIPTRRSLLLSAKISLRRTSFGTIIRHRNDFTASLKLFAFRGRFVASTSTIIPRIDREFTVARHNQTL